MIQIDALRVVAVLVVLAVGVGEVFVFAFAFEVLDKRDFLSQRLRGEALEPQTAPALVPI